MYKSRASSGRNNISGGNITRIRKELCPKVSQRLLADKMQLEEIEMDKMRFSALKAVPDLLLMLN